MLEEEEGKEQEDVREHDRSHIFRFTCNLCGENLNTGAYLRSHMKKVHAKKYKCYICRIKNNSMNDLENHVKEHDRSNISRYSCNKCGKKP